MTISGKNFFPEPILTRASKGVLMNASDKLGFAGAVEVEALLEGKDVAVAKSPDSQKLAGIGPGTVAPAAQPPVSPAQPVPTAEASSRRRRGKRGPQVPLAEAFRRSGLDEEQIAHYMKGLIEVCATKNEPKVMLDALKESSRCLENMKGAPLRVALVHDIPRPQRGPAKRAPATEEAASTPTQ